MLTAAFSELLSYRRHCYLTYMTSAATQTSGTFFFWLCSFGRRMTAVFALLYPLLATVEGGGCYASDVIESDDDNYVTATIPQHCTHLSLGNNYIAFGDVGAAALGEALKVNTVLSRSQSCAWRTTPSGT